MSVRQIKFVESPHVQIGTTRYYPNDVGTFPTQEANQYIDAGWAECVETGEIGERVTGSKPLVVDDVIQQG